MNNSERIIDEELEWFSQIKGGDPLAFRKLFDRYYVPLCRFLYIYIEEKESVEDLILDLFVNIWNQRAEIQIRLTVKAYLFQAARNRSLNYLRAVRPTVPLDQVAYNIADDTVSCSLELQELTQLIEEAILSLPDKCRLVFEKSRFEEMPNQQIASSLDISVKAVEAHMTKALKRIKAFIGEKDSDLR